MCTPQDLHPEPRSHAEQNDNRINRKVLDYETTCWHAYLSIITQHFYAISPILWTDYSLPSQKLFGKRAKEKLNRKQGSQQSSPNATA